MKIIYACLITVLIFFLSCSLPKEQNKNIVYPKERIRVFYILLFRKTNRIISDMKCLSIKYVLIISI